MPDFSTKDKAQALAGVDLPQLAEEKNNFKNTLLKEWTETGIKEGRLDPAIRQGMSDNTSYSN